MNLYDFWFSLWLSEIRRYEGFMERAIEHEWLMLARTK